MIAFNDDLILALDDVLSLVTGRLSIDGHYQAQIYGRHQMQTENPCQKFGKRERLLGLIIQRRQVSVIRILEAIIICS